MSLVKEVQRRSEDLRLAWETYADAEGGGLRDPGRHDAVFLKRFLDLVDLGPEALKAAMEKVEQDRIEQIHAEQSHAEIVMKVKIRFPIVTGVSLLDDP